MAAPRSVLSTPAASTSYERTADTAPLEARSMPRRLLEETRRRNDRIKRHLWTSDAAFICSTLPPLDIGGSLPPTLHVISAAACFLPRSSSPRPWTSLFWTRQAASSRQGRAVIGELGLHPDATRSRFRIVREERYCLVAWPFTSRSPLRDCWTYTSDSLDLFDDQNRCL